MFALGRLVGVQCRERTGCGFSGNQRFRRHTLRGGSGSGGRGSSRVGAKWQAQRSRRHIWSGRRTRRYHARRGICRPDVCTRDRTARRRSLLLDGCSRESPFVLMAKSSMTRAIRTAAFAIGLAVALLLAITPSLAATLLSDPPQVVSLLPNAREVVTFTSPDPLGLTFVTYAAVGVTNGSVSVTVMRDNVTLAAPKILTSTQRAVLVIEPSLWVDPATWSLVFRNTQNASTFLTFVLQKGVVPTLFSTVPFLVFLYGAVQIGWWVVLRPIRERTKETSLRSAAEIDSGERLYDPSAPIPDAPALARADRMTSSFVEPPPPSPSAPPPPPRPAPALRTPKAEPPRPGAHAPAREPETAESLVRKAER